MDALDPILMAPIHSQPPSPPRMNVHMETLPPSGHVMSADDPDSPQNLPTSTKIYVSADATALAFVV